MKVVTPFRPFPPESVEHQELGPFDWLDAIRMLTVSVTQSCHCPVEVLTDLTTPVPGVARRYATTSTRLQRWLLEILLAYASSDAFDQDTILVSPDTLLMDDLGVIFANEVDLTILVRQPVRAVPWRAILNSVQWWRHAAKPRLIAFYTEALALSETLPEYLQTWGGDTEAMRLLLQPIQLGFVGDRGALRVEMLPARRWFVSISDAQMAQLDAGAPMTPPTVPIFDFKWRRKHHMRAAFEQLFPAAVCA